MSTIFLPADEDTQVIINIKGKKAITIDIFELEDIFVAAQSKSDEMGTSWKNEFPKLFQQKTKEAVSPGQAVLLWEGIKTQIVGLKKNLLNELESSSKQGSQSSRKMKKK